MTAGTDLLFLLVNESHSSLDDPGGWRPAGAFLGSRLRAHRQVAAGVTVMNKPDGPRGASSGEESERRSVFGTGYLVERCS
jgi:hypothetical protein